MPQLVKFLPNVLRIHRIIAVRSCNVCAVSKPDVLGRYMSHGNFENRTQLILRADSTYSYTQQAAIMIFKGNGKWSLNRDTLKLRNSDTTLMDGNPIHRQTGVRKSQKLIEIIDGKLRGASFKRS